MIESVQDSTGISVEGRRHCILDIRLVLSILEPPTFLLLHPPAAILKPLSLLFTECTLYYLCVHGKPELKECPRNTVWDTDKLICNWPVDVTRAECKSVVFAALQAVDEGAGTSVGKQDDEGVNNGGVRTKEPLKEESPSEKYNNSIENNSSAGVEAGKKESA